MDKRAKTQFWLEFTIDIVSLAASTGISFLFSKYIWHKVDKTDTVHQWIIYCLLIFSAFLLSYFLFHTNVNIKRRSKIAEIANTVKNF